MSELKPNINFELKSVQIHLKPWKGKINCVVAAWKTNTPIEEFVQGFAKHLKESGKYKRRIITGYSVQSSLWIKL